MFQQQVIQQFIIKNKIIFQQNFFNNIFMKENQQQSFLTQSNSLPLCKVIYQGPLPKAFYFKGNKDLFYSKFEKLKSLRNIFSKLKFEEIIIEAKDFIQQEQSNTFLFFANLEKKIFILIMINHEAKDLSLKLTSRKCKVHSSVFSNHRWDYPRHVSHWMGNYQKLNEMSLRFCDYLLHYKTNVTYHNEFMEQKPWQKTLYQTIKKQGLTNAVLRMGFIINKNKMYSISMLYQKISQLETGQQIIKLIIGEL